MALDNGLYKMMRVLHVYRTYYPDSLGGLQEAIRQICLATGQQGVESRIFTLSPHPVPEEIVRPEAVVNRCRSWWAPASCDLGGIAALRRFAVMAEWADVIHYHFPWPFADVLHLLLQPRKPALMTYHSDIVRQRFLKMFYSPLMDRMLRSMAAIVATSPAYATTSPVLVDARIAGRVRVIPLGVDEHSYPARGDHEVFSRLGLKIGEPYFLFVGVLRYYKGLHFLVEAAERVNARIVIAGAGSAERALKGQVEALGLDNIMFTGQITEAEKVSLERECMAMVLPSHIRSEAFGMVLIEAGMYGRPMISCEVGSGTSFVNVDGETGIVVPPEDPAAMAEAMNRLLKDPDLAGRFGKAARRRYETLFSGEALGKSYAELYQDLMPGR